MIRPRCRWKAWRRPWSCRQASSCWARASAPVFRTRRCSRRWDSAASGWKSWTRRPPAALTTCWSARTARWSRRSYCPSRPRPRPTPGLGRRLSWPRTGPGCRSVEQCRARQAVALHDAAQARQRVQLDLAHALARHTDLLADIFQRRALMPMQAETALHHGALLLGEMFKPVLQHLVHVVGLRLHGGLHALVAGDHVQHVALAVTAHHVAADHYALVEPEQALHLGRIAVEHRRDLLAAGFAAELVGQAA